MSRDASITLDWADGTYVFWLKYGQIMQLQEACDAGPFFIYKRLIDGGWMAEDISNIIRLGLIGGGMEPVSALKLVRDYVEARPLMENREVAFGVLSAAIMGVPEEESAKKNDEEKAA